MERKMIACALHTHGAEGEALFEGYASVFHTVDSQQDRVMPGAFAETIRRHRLNGRTRSDAGAFSGVKLLWQHRPEEPIGVILHLEEDAFGLKVQGQLLLDVQRAREAYALLQSGAMEGLSIGFTVSDAVIDSISGVRLLKALELWEISLVTFPAHPAAQVQRVKSTDAADPETTRLERALSRIIHLLTL